MKFSIQDYVVDLVCLNRRLSYAMHSLKRHENAYNILENRGKTFQKTEC